MKRYLLYFFAMLLAFGTACVKSVPYVPPATPTSGVYSGTFKSLHRSNDSQPYDTIARANITLTINNSTGIFAVTGDTSKVHAGSYGTYGYDGGYMVFADKTYPTSGVTPTKTHLSGYYLYALSTTGFNMVGNLSDTVGYIYQFVKQP